MKRKLLAIIVSILLLCTTLPLSVFYVAAETSGTTGDCTWTLDDSGHLTISGEGAMEDYSSKVIDGAYRTSAPWGWKITSVTIEDGVTTIGEYAFYQCPLTSVIIPDGVTTIGKRAFYECSSLTSVTIPDSVTTIEYGAFDTCTSLASVTIPDSVISIGEYAFGDCYSLESVTIPDSVTTIEDGAFSDCTSLTSISVSAANSRYSSMDGVLFNKDQTCLVQCPGSKSGEYIIPNTVISVENCAFHGCTSLTTVTIPDSVTSLGENVFYQCSNLTAIIVPDSVTQIPKATFYECTGLVSITIPDTVTSIGEQAFYKCTNLNNIILPESVSALGKLVFSQCSTLTSIVIPDGVTQIPQNAFAGCTSLTTITIPASVTFIDNNAFIKCDSLTDVYFLGSESTRQNNLSIQNLHSHNDLILNATWHYYDVRSNDIGLLYTVLDDEVAILGYDETMPADVIIPSTIEGYPVTNIVSRAFFECTTLASIVIPDSVTNIGSYAFYQCTGLVSVTLPKGITDIKPRTFYGCSALTAIDIPHGITMLQNYAFGNCTSLASVTIPNSVIAIRTGAFSNCEALPAVNIPASVTSLGYAAFATGADLYESGGKLKAIHVDENNPAYSSIDGVLFSKDQTTIIKCPGGRGGIYTVPSSVTTIGAGAFTGCHNLSAIHLPEGVNSIGGSAFSYCTGLTVFSIPEGVASIEGSTFYCCDSIYSITIPSSVTSIGSSAFHQCYDLFDVYYGGTEEEQANITISETYNTYLTDAAWHYVDEPYQDPSFLIYEIVDGEAIITDATDTPARLTIPATLGGCPVTTIADEAFYWMSGMHNVIIPNTVTYIGERAFWSCQNLYSIKIPDSVTYIGEEAFYDCQGLSYVSLGDGIRSIEYNTFGNCINLWKVHIPDSVEVIKEHAFSNCRKLASLYIPEGVTTIKQCAFIQCYAVTAVSLPHSLATLGDFAFDHCEALTDVYYNGTEEEWKNTTYRENAAHEYLFNATWHYNCINPKDHYSGRVDNSVMDTEDGDGLAYKFDLKLNGLKAIQGNRIDFTNATVSYKGKICKVVAMGAVVSNINNKKMELSDVNGSTVINVPVTYLTDLESENCAFAIRIINIPETALNRTIYARPYYVIETQDGTVTVYGDISSASCTEYL